MAVQLPAVPPPDAAAEDALIPLSALQHYLFCPRQCALIHVEQLWAEDAATAEGRLLHEKADGGRGEKRPGVRIARGLALRSFALGVSGKADVVEFLGAGKDAGKGEGGAGRPFPVEYKRGKPKAHRADEVQLCAQAICLEEMFGIEVPDGALFYGQPRRRHPVVFDAELRALTARVAAEARAMIAAGRTPAPVAMPACRRCSLQSLCAPDSLSQPPSVLGWLSRQIGD
ncbi:CRISPR-associated protein Cas4 [Xanthobacter oligotrophicus]|uniref:CRISPR-associated protein Cas4 n=1 Tax=Xanthobacter oligotrophicus TaxID=2607286 RepID=UPI0011F2A857|nr:CRISPR-associated protein Cas4 [Xanthobacter oligotrophicus]MCG5234074.1 CRISPR-associated protein Cas4 [Xanthobacter oligotrophicus]